jgi:hypothetical protein
MIGTHLHLKKKSDATYKLLQHCFEALVISFFFK